MSSQIIEIKFHELSKKLINGLTLNISLIKNNIGNEKYLKIKPFDSSIRNKEIDLFLWITFSNILI